MWRELVLCQGLWAGGASEVRLTLSHAIPCFSFAAGDAHALPPSREIV